MGLWGEGEEEEERGRGSGRYVGSPPCAPTHPRSPPSVQFRGRQSHGVMGGGGGEGEGAVVDT